MKQRITILGEPKAQKRHRSTRVGKFTRQYDPSAKDKEDFLATLQGLAPKVPYDEPLMVQVIFYFQRPKTHFGTGRNAGKLKASAPRWHTKKPDKDNLEKMVYDALNKVFWRDDSIICYGRELKLYDSKPRIEILICSIDEPTPDVYLKHFGYLAINLLKDLPVPPNALNAWESGVVTLLKGLVGVAVPGSAGMSDKDAFEAIAWLNSNYKLEGVV